MWQRLERVRTILQIVIAVAAICGAVSVWWRASVPAWLTVLLVATGMAGGFLLGRRSTRTLPSKLKARPPELIDTIAFKYADDPTNHGWRITQDDVHIRTCRLTLQSDSEVGQFLRVEAEPGARLEYPLPPSDFTADRFQLQYKPDRGSAFYAMCNACGVGPDSHYWIQYQIGRDKPKRFSPGEWVVYVQPSALHQKWLTLDCDVVGDFNATFGRDGLEFDHLSLFRLRGNLSISTIRLYSAQPAS